MSLTSTEVHEQVSLFEFAPGKKASIGTLKKILPDVETALFFAKAYKLDHEKLATLLKILFKSSVLDALMSGSHSTELQDYIGETVPEEVLRGQPVSYVVEPPKSEILAQLWGNVEITLAKSIQEVADTMSDILDALPGMTGKMTFEVLAKMNRQRPTIGSYEASIRHARQEKNLVILDVSGSMTEGTIRTIVDDVVALSYNANATLAIVSNNTFVWDPGTYDTSSVLGAAEYSGTHYETLLPLLQEDWGTVVTIADYDSSQFAKNQLARCVGRVGKVVDVSLVNQPTYLAQCVGQLADSVEPILIAAGHDLT